MTRALTWAALALALVFEAAVYGHNPGIGYTVFWLGTVMATAAVNHAAERPALPYPWMFVPSLFFAASLYLYDAGVVVVWSSLLTLLGLLWAAGWNLTPPGERGSLARLFPTSTFHPAPLLQASGQTWRPLLTGASRPSAPVLRGLLLALPLLLVFGGLLASADQVFAKALGSLEEALGMVSLSFPLRLAVWLVLFAGWLKLWLGSAPPTAPEHRSPLGATEMQIAIGAVNLLLLGFLMIQLRYLFGGAALVESLGLNYADYARRGFFELSACIALILPLVMLAYQTAESREEASLRWSGGALVVQAGGLAVSAFRRMLLYIDSFGLSVERFYAAAGIVVALAILAWAAYTCFRPHPLSWLLTRQTVTVMFLLGGLALLDVEGGIARFNLHRAGSGRSLDIEYFRTLSCDAVPALLEQLPDLDPSHRQMYLGIARGLVFKGGERGGPSANLSRTRAARGVVQAEAAYPADEPADPSVEPSRP